MIIAPLSLEEAKGDRDKYAVITSADVVGISGSASATTGTLTIAQPAPVTVTGLFVVVVTTAFTSSDGSLVNLTLSIGDAGSASRYISAVELLSSPSAGYQSATYFCNLTSPTTSIICTFTSTSGHYLGTLTAGQIEIFWAERNIAKLASYVSTQSSLAEITEPVS